MEGRGDFPGNDVSSVRPLPDDVIGFAGPTASEHEYSGGRLKMRVYVFMFCSVLVAGQDYMETYTKSQLGSGRGGHFAK